MKLVRNNISLQSLAEGEQAIDYAGLTYQDLRNLTEYHLYDDDLPRQMRFAMQHENEIIGEIQLNGIRWYNRKAGLSFFVDEMSRGKGHAQTALQLILEHVFGTMNFHRLEAEVMDYNPAAKSI